MKTVLLHVKYKNLSPGDFAGFEDEEADYLLSHSMPIKDERTNSNRSVPFGVLAKNVVLLKAFTGDELGKLFPRLAGIATDKEPDDCLCLLAVEAERLIKDGAAEEMIPVRYRKDVKLTEHTSIQRGTVKNHRASEVAKLTKDGTVRPIG